MSQPIDRLNLALEGRYRIERQVGEGGMATVYLADDLRHERKVALKVLKPELSVVLGPERFLAEIKTTANLQHPHILPLFDSGEADGVLFYVMPYVEGESLRDKIDRERQLSIDEAVDLARKVARGLHHAHGHGVVHRDIKPGNILLGEQGDPLVTDFGIALAVAEAAQGRITETGLSLGTPHYMSPEQATADRDVDPRSDVYAIGCVLYEMLAGEPPFTAPTTPAVLAKILTFDPPSITDVRRTVPPNVAATIAQALEKLPADRFRSALEFAQALENPRFRRRGEVPTSGRGRAYWTAAAAIAALLTATGGYALLERGRSPPPAFSNPRQITSASGLEDNPTWSPDATRVAYHSNQSGDMDIWLALVGTGEPVNLTGDAPSRDMWPAWSPDGTQVAYASSVAGAEGCYVVSALGGVPRLVAPGNLGRPAWSPDGEELACIVIDEQGSWVQIITLATREVRRLELPGDDALRYGLSWSPDGRFLAYVDSPEREAQATTLRVLRLEDGDALEITDGTSRIASPEWDRSGRYLYFASNRGGSMDLWRQEIDGDGEAVGETLQVTTGLQIRSASFSPDGSRFAYSSGRLVANVYSAPLIADGTADWSDVEQLTFDQAYAEYLDVSRDGERLVFSSDRAGNSDIWISSASGGDLRQLTTHALADWDPKLSPDGREVAFYSIRSGNRDIWVIPAAGGVPRQVTDDPALEWQPSWSPDGSELAFISGRSGVWRVWVSGAEGGEARQLTTGEGFFENYPMWSPDGEWILFVSNRRGSTDLWRAPAGGGDAEMLKAGGGYPRWSLDGREVHFLSVTTGTIGSLSVADRTLRTLVDLNGRQGTLGRFALATSGERLFFTWDEPLGDIWVMDVDVD